jgi:hypothetical protein
MSRKEIAELKLKSNGELREARAMYWRKAEEAIQAGLIQEGNALFNVARHYNKQMVSRGISVM